MIYLNLYEERGSSQRGDLSPEQEHVRRAVCCALVKIECKRFGFEQDDLNMADLYCIRFASFLVELEREFCISF